MRERQIVTIGADLYPTFRDRMRDALTRACAASGMERSTIAAKLSEAHSRPTTKHMLDKYLSYNEDIGFRAEEIPAFCCVTGSIEPLKVIAEAVGFELLSPQESEIAEIIRLERKRTALDAEIARLRSRSGIK